MKYFSLIILLIFVSGCKKTDMKSYETDFKKYFKNYDGAFVLYDYNNRYFIKHNEERCKIRFSPCSTFKIPNSLIGLEMGVIAGKDFVLKWDGVKRRIDAWNKDHTLETAFRNSVVWYYQELARRVGNEKMSEYINKISYGNKNISGGVDKFWLMSSLEISAEEQVEFLKNLFENKLPFSERTMNITKEIMVLDSNSNFVFRGKTGSGESPNEKDNLGWFVGYVTLGNNTFIFATNILGEDANGMKAKEITIELLKSMRIM